ncbi:RNA polymerase sigma factor, partial [bacterium]|nr:RNA polymerase sigma factor [bacterium]
MNEPISDGAIIQQVLQGDRNAFRTLVERYHGMVYSVAYGMRPHTETARDAVQEVFYRAFKRLEQFKPEQSFGAWVRRITVNYMLDKFKKKKLPTESIVNDEGEIRDFADDPDLSPREELLTQDRDEAILAAIDELPEKYKDILILRHFEDLSYEEIEQETDLPLGTVTT